LCLPCQTKRADAVIHPGAGSADPVSSGPRRTLDSAHHAVRGRCGCSRRERTCRGDDGRTCAGSEETQTKRTNLQRTLPCRRAYQSNSDRKEARRYRGPFGSRRLRYEPRSVNCSTRCEERISEGRTEIRRLALAIPPRRSHANRRSPPGATAYLRWSKDARRPCTTRVVVPDQLAAIAMNHSTERPPRLLPFRLLQSTAAVESTSVLRWAPPCPETFRRLIQRRTSRAPRDVVRQSQLPQPTQW